MTEFAVDATDADGRNGRPTRAVPTRRALVVAGMHRSGTSAFAGLLGLVGAAFPADMAEGAEDNKSGFWEPLPIKELDDELLALAGSRWDDVVAVPTESYESEAAVSLVGRAVALLEKEYSDASLFVLKDPRICRLLPFWQRVFAAAGVDARYLLPLRNPLEVAASLKRRNDFPTEKSLLLWLEHVLQAERYTRGQPRALPRYEDLLDDPHGVISWIGTSLGIAWPRMTARTRLQIDRFLVHDLRHHAYPDHELGSRREVVDWVARTYRALLGIAAGGADETDWHASLDQVSGELRSADAAYGSLLAALELDLGAAQGEARDAKRELEARDATLAEIAAEQTELGVQLADLREQLALAASERERLAGELEARVAGHSNDLRELGRLRSEFDARGREVEVLEAERQRQREELEMRLAEHSADLQELAQVRAELESLTAQAAELEVGRTRLEAELAAAAGEGTQLRDQLSEAVAARTSVSEELRRAEDRVQEQDQELQQKTGEIRALGQQLEVLEAERERQREELEARLAAHSKDLEELGRARSEAEATAKALADLEADRARLKIELDRGSATRAAELTQLRGELITKESELAAAADDSARIRDQFNEALAARTIYADELKRALDRLEEQHRAAAAGQAQALQERTRLETDLAVSTKEAARLSDQLAEAAADRTLYRDERDRARGELASLTERATALERDRARLEAELSAAAEESTLLRGQLSEALVTRTVTSEELKRTLDRLEEQEEVAATERAAAAQELEAKANELAQLYADLACERESARMQLAAAARERERLHGELETRVTEHSATLLELGRVRSELVGVQTHLLQRSLRGRLRRVRRWPMVKLYSLWAAVVPVGVRLRVRYASQLGSWLARPTPTRLHWVRAYFSLRRSGAFDYQFYALRYPEVIRARMNPLMHYIEHGAREGRDPSAHFSTAAYLAQGPDLDPRRRNPLFDACRCGEAGLTAAPPPPAPAPLAAPGGAASAARSLDKGALPPPRAADWRLPSNTGVEVICLPIIDWHYRFQRPQQLATQFAAAGHRVFYAETKFHQDGDSVLVDDLADGVWGVRLPGPRERIIYTSTLEGAELERLLAALDSFRRVASISRAVVVVDLPFWAPLALEAARRFGWRVIYDCMDHHAGFLDDGFGSAAVRIAIEENEEALLHEADAVLTTSRLLNDRVRPLARKTVLLPNATDFDHFNRRPGRLAVDESLERPVIGYYGAISSWFDIELVAAAARARPHWSFVLVGSTFGADVTALETLPNVLLPGERPYAEIPAYLHAFDVACIPFKLNALTEATNPVKFYEYLSAGKPIVAARLPELESYEGYYYPARTAEEFVTQVERALDEHSPEAASARIALALNNTWSSRWKELDRLMRSWFGRAAIIVLSYDNPNYLRQCLESIWAKTRYPHYDLYVVENGRNTDIDAYLSLESETQERLHVIRPGANLGFARANNLAVELAGDCEYVVLLNDDVVVTEGWLSGLLRHLEDDAVGIVGPVTNWTGNEARIDVDYESLDGMDEFAARHAAAHAGEAFEITSLAMYCVAVRRRLFDSLGRLDERFEIGMFEDDDFAQRVRDAGLRVVCAEDVFIHHWGRASFKRMSQEEYETVFEANRRRFEEKWGRTWQPHRSR